MAFLSLLTAALLGVASAFMSALALGATALIVPGTGTPNANIVANYREHARDYYMQGTACTNDGNCGPNNTGNPANGGLLGIDYPASFWPVPYNNWCPGLTCDTWNASVGTGVMHLDTALRASTGPVVIFGYSQGGAVVSTELANFADETDQLRKIDKVVTIGGIMNPDGGLWSRLSFIPYVPILNITPRPQMPVEIPELKGKIYTVGMQYDPVVYSPLFWGNPISLLNAAAALLNVHGYYLADDGSPLAYGYTPTELAEQMNCSLHKENCRTDSYGNTYVMIPARSLPLTDLVMSLVPTALTPIVKPFVDLATPVLKVFADLGYDWSGDPGVVRPLSILPFNPFQNWAEVGLKLVAATIEGIQAFVKDLGGLTTPVAPTTPSPVADTTSVSAFTAPADAPTDSPEPQALSSAGSDSDRVASLASVPDVTETVGAETDGEQIPTESDTTQEAVDTDAAADDDVDERESSKSDSSESADTTEVTSPSETDTETTPERDVTTATDGAKTSDTAPSAGGPSKDDAASTDSAQAAA